MLFLYDQDIDLLFTEMNREVNQITQVKDQVIITARQAVFCIKKYIRQLRAYMLNYDFESPQAEIHFFKQVKPKFYALLIYYSRVYEIEYNRPIDNLPAFDEYLQNEIRKINLFFDRHREFCQYISGKSTYMDHVYFMRDQQEYMMVAEYAWLDIDHRFSAPCDHLMALADAYRMLMDYLIALRERPTVRSLPATKNKLMWSAPKTGLVELIYALQASNVFNDANLEMRTLANYFSEVFEVHLANVYKTYEEIRLRKKSRTDFLDTLRRNLIAKMDYDDEHAK